MLNDNYDFILCYYYLISGSEKGQRYVEVGTYLYTSYAKNTFNNLQ